MLEAVLERPNKPKNWKHKAPVTLDEVEWYAGSAHHVVEPGRAQLSHHRLRESIEGGLEQSEYDVICPV